MRNILFFVFFAIFSISQVLSSTVYGSNTFYAQFQLTNLDFGAGASFLCDVWYINEPSSNIEKMRIDYSYANGTVYQSELYDFVTLDKYQICQGNCLRQTYTTPAPVFVSNGAGYSQMTACPVADYTTSTTCASGTGCVGFQNSNPTAQSTYQLGFNSSGALCLVRWAVQPPYTYGNEWHVSYYQAYSTGASWPNEDPSNLNTYSSVIANVQCPQPLCQSQVDIALIIDESGSITTAHAYPDVQNFALAMVNAFNGSFGPNATRMGLAYFSGMPNCQNASNTKSWTGCSGSGCNGDSNLCYNCGGRWDVEILTPTSNQTLLQNIISTHPIQNGYTCASCGLQQGINILNADVRPGVPRILFYFTDGIQNRQTDFLAGIAQAAADEGIIVYAVGVASYQYDTLLTITGNASRVFTSASYTALVDIIPSVTKHICDPLPPWQTCTNCLGICACGLTCTCPNSCDDGNLCTEDICSSNPSGTQGLCLHPSNVSSCDDGNPCTQNLCSASTGCYFPPIERPSTLPPDTNCYYYTCDPSIGGWVKNDNSANFCGTSSDECVTVYCNTTTNSCQSLSARDITYLTTEAYVDALGVTQTITGCAPPSNAYPCTNYTCSASTGVCSVVSNCQCITDSQCNDHSGCTTDTCVNYKCVYTPIDCFSILSDGACPLNTQYSTNTSTGYAVFTDPSLLQSTYAVDSNGLPSPSTGVTRTCDQLACYAGEPSNYQCVSDGDESYTCQRTVVSECTLTACKDTYCRSVGQTTSWTNNQLQADCGGVYTPDCSTTNKCLVGSCNTSWAPSSGSSWYRRDDSTRCIFQSISCDDDDACTADSCDPSSGCVHNTLPLPGTNNSCVGYHCDPVKGNITTIFTDPNPDSNQCQTTYCSTSAQWEILDSSSYPAGEIVQVTDYFGNTISVTGCGKPSNAPQCLVYNCQSWNGQCTVDSSNCQCTGDSGCNDHNGCTHDSCVDGICCYTPIDCFSAASNGGCQWGANSYPSSNATGLAIYNNPSLLTSEYTVDSNGFPNSTSTFSCDQLACYAGQMSTYQCKSTGDGSHICQRTAVPCTSSSCQDSVCQSVGQQSGWTQLQSNCQVTITPECNAEDKCHKAICNTTWSHSDSSSLRCEQVDISSSCNDNNVCTADSCDPSSGCVNTPLPLPGTNNSCFQYYCDPVKGNITITTQCPQDANNLCNVSYCDNTLGCQYLSKSSFTFGTTQNGIQGCAKPSTDGATCRQYSCNPTTGACVVDTSSCACLTNEACYDGTGCTIDTCDTTNNVCNHVPYDCLEEYYNQGAQCRIGHNFTGSDTTGICSLNLYEGGASFNNGNPYISVDSNGWPIKGSCGGCDYFGCFNNTRNQYRCSSNSETSVTCEHTSTPCPSNGCAVGICNTLGYWTSDNQIATSCTYQTVTCNDGNRCTNDYCNASAPFDYTNTNAGCYYVPIDAATVCDDGDKCTLDLCDPDNTAEANPCVHNTYSQQYIEENICNAQSTCVTITCQSNNCYYCPLVCPYYDQCTLYVCNATTNNTCVATPGFLQYDHCGVCGGDGYSCPPNATINPVTPSIASSVAIATSIAGSVALAAGIIAGKRSYDQYQEVAAEAVTSGSNSPAYIADGNSGENPGIATHSAIAIFTPRASQLSQLGNK